MAEQLNSVKAPFGYKAAFYTDKKTGVTQRFVLDEIDANHNVRTFPKEWSFTAPDKAKVVEVATPQSAALGLTGEPLMPSDMPAPAPYAAPAPPGE